MINSESNLSELYQIAVSTLDDLEEEEKFIVKDLFRGFEWARISRPYRTKLGSLFLLYAKGDGRNTVEILGKTPQNQQIYQKM